jgi:ATP/ADP translocase
MEIRALTHRGYWTRIVVFTASLLLYAWIVRLMTQENSIAGIVLFSLLALASVAGLIATVTRRPSSRPR